MVIKGKVLDDILRELYIELSNSTDNFNATKGKGYDLLGQKILLKNPRGRISATATRGRLISALAEFCWYMHGSSDLEFIKFYIPNYPSSESENSLREAYGPRLIGTGEFGYGINQIERTINRLKKNPDTRRAVISILDTNDLEPKQKEAPCTVCLQFIIRRNRLHLVAMMRSNDAYLGFTHDLFCFTLLQEIVARSLGIKLGEYHHFSTSLHIYERNLRDISSYIEEGFQSHIFAMPKMPIGDQFSNLKNFLTVEAKIRQGNLAKAEDINLPPYWKDLAIILLRRADLKFKRGTKVLEENFSQISDNFYKNFFLKPPIIKAEESSSDFYQPPLSLSDIND